jgi:diguanylate cyclase (GGDEF)-like protein
MDIDARTRAESELRHLAGHDPLSGVLNRRRFEQELERELGHSASAGSRAALLLLDVDRFKLINDRFGPAAGDAVIARLGSLLTKRLRSGDAVARLGGHEFAVILRRVDDTEARRVADELVELAKSSLGEVLPGGETVTLSVGVVSFGDSEPPSGDELLAAADRATYDAKRAGGGRAAAPAPAGGTGGRHELDTLGLGDDRADQIGLAQPLVALDTHGRGDRLQLWQDLRFEDVTFGGCHVHLPCGWTHRPRNGRRRVGEPPGCRVLKWAPGGGAVRRNSRSLLILFPSTGSGGAARAAGRELNTSDHVTRSTARTELVLMVVPPPVGLAWTIPIAKRSVPNVTGVAEAMSRVGGGVDRIGQRLDLQHCTSRARRSATALTPP